MSGRKQKANLPSSADRQRFVRQLQNRQCVQNTTVGNRFLNLGSVTTGIRRITRVANFRGERNLGAKQHAAISCRSQCAIVREEMNRHRHGFRHCRIDRMAPSGDHGVSGHPDVLCSKREKEKLGITRTSRSWTGIPSMQGHCANQRLEGTFARCSRQR